MVTTGKHATTRGERRNSGTEPRGALAVLTRLVSGVARSSPLGLISGLSPGLISGRNPGLAPCLVFAALLALSGALRANAESRPADTHDVYWSISRSGEDSPAGYLLGTVHSEDPRVLEFSAPFLEQLGACDIFAMELVPDLPTMQRLMVYMELPAGTDLESLIGPLRFGGVRRAAAPYGIPDDRLRRMKPWAAMMTLSLPPPKTGLFLDFSLSLRAAGAGREVVGLETLEEQLAFLEGMSFEDQVALLDQAIADHEHVQAVHDQMVDAYLTENLAALEALAGEQMASLDASARNWFQAEGIDARNQRMAANALALLERGCTFIAVGALHLPGEQGLLALLRAAGYRLDQLPSPFLAVQQDRHAGSAAQ